MGPGVAGSENETTTLIGTSPDDEVLIALSTARTLFVGTTSVRSVGVRVASAKQMETVKAEIATLLEQRHDIAAGGTDDFTSVNGPGARTCDAPLAFRPVRASG